MAYTFKNHRLSCHWSRSESDWWTMSEVSLFFQASHGLSDYREKECSNRSSTGVPNDIRGYLLLKRAFVIFKWSDHLNMPRWASQLNKRLKLLDSFHPDPRVHLIFRYRKSAPWEIRCLEWSLISVDGFLLLLKCCPIVRKITVFLLMQRKFIFLLSF